MKKYSNKHLESVEPEFILAIEESIQQLKSGKDCLSVCPAVMERIECDDWCPDNFNYIKYSDNCPCNLWGRKQAIMEAQNLVSQWKAWVQITEE